MKRTHYVRIIPLLASVLLVSLATGCVSREQVTTYDVTKTGKDWVENKSEQRYRDSKGRLTVEKQNIYEKIKCVGRKGKQIDASTPEECIDKGGKVIDEVRIEEESIRGR